MPDVEYRCANRAGPVANRRPAASRPRGRCRDQTRPQPWGAKLAPNGVRPHVTGGGTLSFDYHPGGFGGAVFEVRTDTGQDGVTVVTVAGEVEAGRLLDFSGVLALVMGYHAANNAGGSLVVRNATVVGARLLYVTG